MKPTLRAKASNARGLLIGTAGWSLSPNDFPSFPTEGTHLQRYAQVFPCVEINSSFYRSHQPKTYARWADSVPDDFRFSVKMPRTITHDLRLQDCEEPLRDFIDEVGHLGEKLGCLLVQLPPSLVLDVKVVRRFFALLRKCTAVSIACEPRHATWFTPKGAALLTGSNVAFVQADPSPVPDGDNYSNETSTLYIRLHGSPRMYYSAYDEAFIAAIAEQMRDACEQKKTAWCIFDNTAGGAAVPNALALMERLAVGRG